MDELNAFAHHQVQWKSTSEAYQTNTEMMMRLALGHMGVDPTSIPPPPPAFPQPFHFQDAFPLAYDEGVPPPENEERED